jgi:adenosylmethionine-8-amino-7-oxononanoate aminotransferase
MDSEPAKTNQSRRVWHPYTRFSSLEHGYFPTIVRAEGIYLEDDAGNRYVDAISSWWAAPLGHSHPAIVEAICNQAKELQHSILGNMTHPNAMALAEAVAELMPDPNYHVHFAGDGASAVEAALKICLQYWSNKGKARTRFASLNQAYHGDTLATLSLGYIDAFHQPFAPMLMPAERIPVPPYDATEAECIDAAKELFSEHGHSLAGLIVEPLCQGAGGMRIYSLEYFNAIYKLCREHDVIFIADEIATGFGRTGKMFAYEHACVKPDIVCIGKALSGGSLPISAAVACDTIYETFDDTPIDHTFYHGHTYAGNPIACAAALAALKAYRELDIAACAQQRGLLLADGLSALEDLPAVSDVRCLGMIGAVELRGAKPGGIPIAQQVQRNMMTKGYVIRPLGNVAYLMLPLVTPEAVIREAVEALRSAIVEVE